MMPDQHEADQLGQGRLKDCSGIQRQPGESEQSNEPGKPREPRRVAAPRRGRVVTFWQAMHEGLVTACSNVQVEVRVPADPAAWREWIVPLVPGGGAHDQALQEEDSDRRA